MKLKHIFFIVVFLIAAAGVFAAPGNLDPTFNGNGVVRSNIFYSGTGAVEFRTLAIQPDGKILAVGYVDAGANSIDSHSIVLRCNADGTIDTTFGTNGRADLYYPDYPIRGRVASAMELQPDGKIVLAITERPTTEPAWLCGATRLNADGSVDTGFGVNGLVSTPTPGNWCYVKNIKVQNDGKIVVGGTAFDQSIGTAHLAVIRYDANGVADTTFGANGLMFDPRGSYQDLHDVLLQPDQKIIVTGGTLVEGADQLVARYNADGTRDTTFGSDGLFAFPGQNNLAGNRSAALQPDGRIIVAGAILGSGAHGPGFYMNRVNPNGTLDTTFGANGYVVTQEVDRKVRESTAIVLQPDGKIIIGGSMLYDIDSPNHYADFSTGRYSADGVLEQNTSGKFMRRGESILSSAWGDNGITRTHFTDNVFARITDMKLDAAGRLLVYGYNNGEMVMARYQSDAPPYAGITGRLTTAGGVPIKNISVVLSEGGLPEPRYALTNQFGYYTFSGLPVTENYSVSISSKRFAFSEPQQHLMLNHDELSVDFTAEP